MAIRIGAYLRVSTRDRHVIARRQVDLGRTRMTLGGGRVAPFLVRATSMSRVGLPAATWCSSKVT
eukprot:3048878-Rhodomonas_salina.1